MKTIACLFLVGVVAYAADAPPEMPKPVKEHEWLKQLAGDWTGEGECFMEPGKPLKCSSTETAKMLGGFWCLTDMKGIFGGLDMNGIMTLGYDPEKKKYVGTWVDNVSHFKWDYIGTMDASGKILTLEAEGPNIKVPGKMAKYKDVIEMKSDKHKIFTSSMQGEDGQWQVCMKSESKKK